jgi:hypothetical protein
LPLRWNTVLPSDQPKAEGLAVDIEAGLVLAGERGQIAVLIHDRGPHSHARKRRATASGQHLTYGKLNWAMSGDVPDAKPGRRVWPPVS